MKTTYKNFCGICLSILAFSALPLQQANAQSCATPPSCETLGYTKSVADCSGLDALFCPFDMSKVFCITVKETEQVIPCEVGSILYSDKKCYNNASEDRIPIAVVFDAAGRLAVALESQGDLSWGGAWKDIPSLANCTLANYTTCGNNGKYNTTTILAYGKSQNLSYPAAEACNKYKTIGTSTGEWFLPSTHEAKLLRNQRGNGVNAALKSLNKATIDSAVSSSTEYSDISTVTANDGYAGKGVKYPVRPVLAF